MVDGVPTAASVAAILKGKPRRNSRPEPFLGRNWSDACPRLYTSFIALFQCCYKMPFLVTEALGSSHRFRAQSYCILRIDAMCLDRPDVISADMGALTCVNATAIGPTLARLGWRKSRSGHGEGGWAELGG